MVNVNNGLQLMRGIQTEAQALSDHVERELGR